MSNLVYVHGKVYKANNKLKSQDTTLLTTEDCTKFVDSFLGSDKNLPVNFQHDLHVEKSVGSVLGKIEDLYFDEGNLNCVFSIDPAYPQSKKVIDEIKSGKLLGLSIELNYSIDPTTKLVGGKNMIGLGVVYFPDHENDSTLITGLSENGKGDLALKDPSLMKYLSSTKAEKRMIDTYLPKRDEQNQSVESTSGTPKDKTHPDVPQTDTKSQPLITKPDMETTSTNNIPVNPLKDEESKQTTSSDNMEIDTKGTGTPLIYLNL